MDNVEHIKKEVIAEYQSFIAKSNRGGMPDYTSILDGINLVDVIEDSHSYVRVHRPYYAHVEVLEP